MNFFDEASALPLIQLIVKTASDDKLDSGNNRGLFVVNFSMDIFNFDHHDL